MPYFLRCNRKHSQMSLGTQSHVWFYLPLCHKFLLSFFSKKEKSKSLWLYVVEDNVGPGCKHQFNNSIAIQYDDNLISCRNRHMKWIWMKYVFLFVIFRNEQLPRDFRLRDNSFQMTSFTYDEIQAKTDKRLQVKYG